MPSCFRRPPLWLLCLVLFVAAGCGGEKDKSAKSGNGPNAGSFDVNDLKAVGLAFHNYHDAHRQGPDSWEALLDSATPEQRTSIENVRQAGYQMKWGVRLQDAVDGTMAFVLAESPKHSQKLYLDGSVH